MKPHSVSRTAAALSVCASVLFLVAAASVLQFRALAHSGDRSPAKHLHKTRSPLGGDLLRSPEISAPSSTEVLMTAEGFQPSVVTITVGSEVVWRNQDSATHRISSGLLEHRVYVPAVLKKYSGGISAPASAAPGIQALAQWESLDIPPGDTYIREFDTEGVFPYRCEYHPWHTGMVVVQTLPDLVVEGLSTEPATLLLGHPFSLTVAVRNQGSVDAEEGFWVDWYADPESPPISDQQGDVYWWQDGLAADTTTVLSNSHTLYTSGEHTLYAQVDTLSTVVEGDEENNVSQPYTVTVVAPDLIVQSIATDPIIPTVDVPFTVTVIVANQGDGDALEEFRVDWYADLGTPPISTTVGDLQWWQLGLGVGQTGSFEEAFTFDTPGEHTLYAQVDRDDLVMENDEGNNVTDPVLVTATRPDLLIQSVSTDPETPIANFPFSLTVTVANQSDSSAEDTFAVDWYADPAVPPTSTTPSDGFWEVAGLDPWEPQDLSDIHTFLTEGEHVLYAQVDAPDVVTESNESNNLSSPLTINVASNVVQVCGTINQNTVWHNGMIYVVSCDSTVASGVTLTIEPNVVVKFNYRVGLTVNGTLLAQGTQAGPIVLTANTGTPTPGYWDGIAFGSSSVGSILDHVDIAYGGYGSSANVRVNTAQVTISNSTVHHSSNYGVYGTSLSGITISNTEFMTNTNYAAYLSLTNATFSGGDNTGSGNGYNGIALTGSLGQNTTLPLNPGFAYIIPSGFTVNQGITLTLEPDTVIKLLNGTSGHSEITIRGSLIAHGTPTQPVVFTSLYDDAFAGDTNNDGSATTPAPGNWGTISIEDTGTASFSHAYIAYGGRVYRCHVTYCEWIQYPTISNQGDLTIANTNVSDSYGTAISTRGMAHVSSTTVAFNAGSGIAHSDGPLSVVDSTLVDNTGSGIATSGGPITATRNLLSGNAIGINRTSGLLPTITNNTFTSNAGYALQVTWSGGGADLAFAGNNGSGNGYDAILVSGTFTATGSLAVNPDLPYVIERNSLVVSQGITLTLEPDTVIKLLNGTNGHSQITIRGSLIAHGTPTQPVVFTSLYDDAFAGDTNNDGGATTPAPGNWGTISIEDTGTASFGHAYIGYGGRYYNCRITYCTWDPCPTISNQGDLAFSNSTVTNGYGHGISTGGSATIHQSCISGNAGVGVRNTNTTIVVDAQNNWWGHESGPAPFGSGNGINGRYTCTPPPCHYEYDIVLVIPWVGMDYWVAHHNGGDVPWNEYEAEPVNTANGNYFYSHTYFNIPTRGLPLDLTLSYNSAAPEDGPLGYGWTHTYNLSAAENITDSTVIITYGDGRQDKFTWDLGEYVPPPGTFSTLTEDGGGYHLTEKDQTVYNFDTSGRLVTIVDKNGNTTSLSYSGDDLVTVTEQAGRTLDFTYASGRISQVEDPLGQTVQFTYDASGDLVTITDPRGYDLAFTYESDHRLLTATDANGHAFVQNTYDSAGRVAEQRDAKGNLTTFAYDEVDHLTIVTDPLGNSTTYTYDDVRRLMSEEDPLANTITYTYDESNNRTSVNDKRANTTYYDYDDQGNVTVITDTLGYVTTLAYDSLNNLLSQQDKLDRTTYYGYDGSSNLTVVTDTMGYLTNVAYYSSGSRNGLLQAVTDARGSTTTYDYDAYSNLRSTTDELGSTSWQYHDLAGRLTESEDARGFSSYYEYDEVGNLLVITDTLGYTTHHTYDDVGNRVSMVDANGESTNYAYDEKDLLVTITDTLGYVTSYTYDANDNRLTVTDGTGHTTAYTYDKLNGLKTVQDALGHTVTYGYDANGNRTTLTDALGYMTGYAYDALDRLTSVTDPLIHTTCYGYDAMGSRTVITDANGIGTNYTYDALDRLIGVTDAESGAVSYGYDEVGNRTVITDASLHVTHYTCDDLDRVVAITDPESNTTSYGYDEIGNRTVITDANNSVTQFSFDSENRLATVAYPDTTVSFSYDGLDNRLVMTDTTGTTTYEYDALSRPMTITHPSSAVGYRYDAVNRTQMIYPDGEVVTYTYDLADRLQDVEDWGSRTVTYGYDNADRLSAVQYPNDTSASYSYDNADRLTDLTNSSVVSGTLSTFTYTLDDVGNRLQMVDGDGTTSYSYDDLYRLTQVDYPVGTPATVSYTYDAMGNRTVITTTSTITYTYDTADRLLASGPITFTWDNNGNMLSKGDAGYSYDYANRLVEVISGTQTITFTYNGDGVRVAKCVDGACTTYVQDVAAPLPTVLVETNGGQDTLYTYGLDLVAMTDPASVQTYYHYDGLGSTRNLTNGSGQEIVSYTYDAFGAVRSMTGSSGNEFTFTGEQLGSETNLAYLRARYYDPATARFSSKDRLSGYSTGIQSINRYTYVQNNPVRLVDPSGSVSVEQVWNQYGRPTVHKVVDVGLEAVDVADLALKLSGRGASDLAQNVGFADSMGGSYGTARDLYEIAQDANQDEDLYGAYRYYKHLHPEREPSQGDIDDILFNGWQVEYTAHVKVPQLSGEGLLKLFGDKIANRLFPLHWRTAENDAGYQAWLEGNRYAAAEPGRPFIWSGWAPGWYGGSPPTPGGTK